MSYLKNILFGIKDDREKETNATSSISEEDIADEDCTNGLLLSNVFIPAELIAIILDFLPWRELLTCRLVCETWKDIIQSSVRHEKMKAIAIKNLISSSNNNDSCTTVFSFGHLPFYVNYAIGTKFGRNLLKNPFGNVGQNKLDSWTVVTSGGDGWAVEEVPHGTDPLPVTLEARSCFVTSYRWSYKEQMIDLRSLGISSKIMDEVQPVIKVSEWYSARFDCGSEYKLTVCLLNYNRQPVSEFQERQRMGLWQANKWKEVSFTFANYGPGVRYILFTHGGCDTQFWKGHYGSKMAGGKVIMFLPQRMLRRLSDCS